MEPLAIALTVLTVLAIVTGALLLVYRAALVPPGKNDHLRRLLLLAGFASFGAAALALIGALYVDSPELVSPGLFIELGLLLLGGWLLSALVHRLRIF